MLSLFGNRSFSINTLSYIRDTRSIFAFKRLRFWASFRGTTLFRIFNTSAFSRAKFETIWTVTIGRTIENWSSTWSIYTFHRSRSRACYLGRAIFQCRSAWPITKTVEWISKFIWTRWHNCLLWNLDNLRASVNFRVYTTFIPAFNKPNRTSRSCWAFW